jgi:hypothetical protein
MYTRAPASVWTLADFSKDIAFTANCLPQVPFRPYAY